jgi:hypothetical protein
VRIARLRTASRSVNSLSRPEAVPYSRRPMVGCGRRSAFSLLTRVRPNPSLKRSTNGRPPGPVWRYAVHFRQPGPGVLPLAPA